MNCCVVPSARLADEGEMEIETSVAGVICTAVEVVWASKVAEICAVPVPIPVTRPLLETVATFGAAEDQVAEELTFCRVPFEKAAVTVNCCWPPAAKLAPLGLMASELSVAAWMTTVDWATTEPTVPVITAVPGATPVTTPLELTSATAGFELAQVTDEVTSCVVPSP